MERKEKLLLVTSSLLAAFAIALYVRMYRVFLWGWWLDEFDPYVRYYLAKYTLEHGAGWWWSGAQFLQFWYPYGVDWGKVLLPGTSFYGLFVYALLRPFGVDLWHAVIAAPAIMSSLAVFSMFYLGYKVGQELGGGGLRVGLISAMFTAIMPAFVERGLAAWFDDEPISLFLIPLGLALLLDGLRKPWMGALAGAALGYVAWTWGAHFYVWNLVGLYALLLPTYYFLRLAFTPTAPSKAKRGPAHPAAQLPFDARNFFLSYLLFYLVYGVFVAAIPRYGVNTLISAFNIIPTFGLAAALATWLLDSKLGVTRTVELLRKYMWLIVAVVLASIGVFIAALVAGAIGGKFLATLFPFGRSAIVASVAEHSTTSFVQIVARYGPVLPFILAGVPYLFTPGGLLALSYLATAGYAAATMVRLLVLLAPIATVVAAVGIVKAMENKRLGLLVALAAIISVAMLLSSVMPALDAKRPNYGEGLARQPTQIATSAVGVVSEDFLDMLMWMKTRLPVYEPVASWWDYGYWISIIGNKTSLADNSTINATQIGKIGLALMVPPQVGAEIFTKDFRTRYVLAIMPYVATPLSAGYLLIHEYPPGGDFLKSYWMTRIALENVGDTAKILGATSTNFEDFFYTKVMSYPGPPPSATYAYFTIQGSYYPVPLSLNRTLYAMLFSKVRLVPAYGNATEQFAWVFEGVYQQGVFTTFRDLKLTGGNVYLPGYAPRLAGALQYTLQGWTSGSVEVVADPLTGAREQVPFITTATGPLKLVYVSRPHGWVVLYEVGP